MCPPNGPLASTIAAKPMAARPDSSKTIGCDGQVVTRRGVHEMAIHHLKCKKRDLATALAMLIGTLALSAICVAQTAVSSAAGPGAIPVANAVSPDTATTNTSASTRSTEFKSRNPRYHIEA